MKDVYLNVLGRAVDEEALGRYKAVAGPIMKKHGGVMPPESHMVSGVLAGTGSPEFMLRIKFPEAGNIQAAFADPEYLAVIGERDQAYGDLSIFISEN